MNVPNADKKGIEKLFVYREYINASGELKNIAGFNGEKTVSFIYSGEFNEKGFETIPDGPKQQLKKDGLIICRYALKT
jgi:hypothetical protein